MAIKDEISIIESTDEPDGDGEGGQECKYR